MARYHIKKDGTPGICHAQKGNCPLGGENKHFSSLGEAQNEIDKENSELFSKSQLQLELNDLNNQKKIATGLSKIIIDGKIRDVKLRLDGKDPKKIHEAEHKAKKIEIEKEKERTKHTEMLEDKASISFSKLKSIDLPDSVELNEVIARKYNPNPDKTFRGELVTNAKTNTGTALYGLGRYTTTSKKYASKFGLVRHAEIDELPSNPLRLKSELSFQYLTQRVAAEHGVKYNKLYNHIDPGIMIQRMGYNGLTIGTGSDMTIVKYYGDSI